MSSSSRQSHRPAARVRAESLCRTYSPSCATTLAITLPCAYADDDLLRDHTDPESSDEDHAAEENQVTPYRHLLDRTVKGAVIGVPFGSGTGGDAQGCRAILRGVDHPCQLGIYFEPPSTLSPFLL